MDFLDLDPIARVAGTATMPGSKSISNRVLLLAALARGETVVHDALDADDTRVMLAALRALGVAAMSGSSPEIRIQGCGGAFPVRSADLFLGNDWLARRPDLLEVYPYHLHLQNFIEIFRRQYRQHEGRL